jgi:MFS family permease
VLYLTVGLGLSLANASGALALIGVVALLTAPVAGKIADHYGHERVMSVALWAFAVGMVVPLLTTDLTFLIAAIPVACAAVVLLTLPYSMLMGLLPDRARHGAAAGLFGMSRGAGVLAGPLLAGLAVATVEGLPVLTFAETDGYSAIFVVAGALLLASIPVLRRLHRDGAQPESAL